MKEYQRRKAIELAEKDARIKELEKEAVRTLTAKQKRNINKVMRETK